MEPNRLIAWMAVVTKHEALAVRRSRERLLACLAPRTARRPARRRIRSRRSPPTAPVRPSAPSARAARRRPRALAELKANERLALVLQAQGYSYAEICELCGWTYTKVNRCLAEGRARLRSMAAAA